MKKYTLMIVLGCFVGGVLKAQSFNPVSLIISKAIKVIDLKVQRLQNETLVMQRAEQAAEQALSKTKLAEITGWQAQLATLYEGYFTELRRARPVIAGSTQVKKILTMQKEVVLEYGRLGKDPAVKSQYDALLNTSIEILQTLQTVLTSSLSMKDAERLCMIQTLKDAMGHCLENMQSLNRQQIEITLGRTRMQADLQFVKRLHGIQ
ncbi:hypothetical protein SAMN05444410_10867 [Hydrobacter penzbergensis]|uniref:Conjugal transfer protein TraI n=1 Tax=Hydrobacter penzbergensis TaxID=1235997 RepID=A0A8X8LFB1_9BACT|nr:hypothetical protein [Hydrobacter penzbergensis]SDX02516.1 hypothetical protein SAMN05444410_10867 [Hydrobacter penzbergensis]